MSLEGRLHLLSCVIETQMETFREDKERVNGGFAAPLSPLRNVFLGVLNRSGRCLLPLPPAAGTLTYPSKFSAHNLIALALRVAHCGSALEGCLPS